MAKYRDCPYFNFKTNPVVSFRKLELNIRNWRPSFWLLFLPPTRASGHRLPALSLHSSTNGFLGRSFSGGTQLQNFPASSLPVSSLPLCTCSGGGEGREWPWGSLCFLFNQVGLLMIQGWERATAFVLIWSICVQLHDMPPCKLFMILLLGLCLGMVPWFPYELETLMV